MKFSVQPVVPADAQGLAAAMMGAWHEDTHWHFRWEDPSLDNLVRWCAERLPWNLVNSTTTKRHQKAINIETGEVVGYARWLLPPDLAEKNAWLEAHVSEASPDDYRLFEKKFKAAGYDEDATMPSAVSGDVLQFRSTPLEEADARIMKDGPYLILDYMTVAPAFQRRGIANMLVQNGIEISDKYRQKAHVMATPAGLKLYQNHGFKIVETVCRLF